LTLGGSLILYFFAAVHNVAPSDYIAFNLAYGAISSAILSLAGVAMAMANAGPLFKLIEPIMEAVPEPETRCREKAGHLPFGPHRGLQCNV